MSLYRRPWPRVGEPARAGDVIGRLRGSVADAVTFARETAVEYGQRVEVRVDERRATLPPARVDRPDLEDGPTWDVLLTEDEKPAVAS